MFVVAVLAIKHGQFFRKTTIARDKGKPVVKQGRKAVSLSAPTVLEVAQSGWRLSGCRRQSEIDHNQYIWKFPTFTRQPSACPSAHPPRDSACFHLTKTCQLWPKPPPARRGSQWFSSSSDIFI
jgi:hypothetical protein